MSLTPDVANIQVLRVFRIKQLLRSSLFLRFTKRRIVVSYRRFGDNLSWRVKQVCCKSV